LLYKDGGLAFVKSITHGLWPVFSGTQTLIISVDGTPATTFSITATDFINNNTGYSSVSQLNPVSAWCTVLNAIIPGITATESNGQIVLTSNLGRDERASVSITGGTLSILGVFPVSSSIGYSEDYIFDRNIAQIKLKVPLSAGDYLTVGTTRTEGFVESKAFTTATISSDADFWFVSDTPATIIPHFVTAATGIIITQAAKAYGYLTTFTSPLGTYLGTLVNDWIIVWDSVLNSKGISGAYRINYALPDGSAIGFEMPNAISTGGPFYAIDAGISIVRTDEIPHKLTLPFATSAIWSPDDVATSFNSQSSILFAEVINTKIRVNSKTSSTGGYLALVCQNRQAINVGFTTGDAVESTDSHQAVVTTSPRTWFGVPVDEIKYTNTYLAAKNTLRTASVLLDLDSVLVGLRGLEASLTAR
jgi:hypothetical protein